MPLAGGAADKLGNRYEAAWTIARLLDVLLGRWDAIRLEPPGPEGEGVEFWLEKGDRRTYYQVKRQNSSRKRWTLSELNRFGILAAARDKLSGVNNEFVFASTQDAYELRELSERARSARSWEEFEDRFLSSNEWRRHFESLQSYWNDLGGPEAYNLLCRIRVNVSDEQTLRRHLDSLGNLTLLKSGQWVAEPLQPIKLSNLSSERTPKPQLHR